MMPKRRCSIRGLKRVPTREDSSGEREDGSEKQFRDGSEKELEENSLIEDGIGMTSAGSLVKMFTSGAGAIA